VLLVLLLVLVLLSAPQLPACPARGSNSSSSRCRCWGWWTGTLVVSASCWRTSMVPQHWAWSQQGGEPEHAGWEKLLCIVKCVGIPINGTALGDLDFCFVCG
jgi:hypothetical protein